jgi:hypothetical protein
VTGVMDRLREWLRGDWTPPSWYIALSGVAAAVSLIMSLVACNSPAAGIVTEHPKPVLIGGVMYRHLRVDGKKVNVDKATYDACPVGARWPDCRDGAK